MTSPKTDRPSAKAAKCPICAKPAVKEYAPFCSRRCANIDLHRWLSGAYAIPAVEDESEGEEEGEA